MKILAVDPGSTSTKIGVLVNGNIIKMTVNHDREIINSFKNIIEQKDMRRQIIENFLDKHGLSGTKFDAVAGRGGLIKPVTGGVYEVNEPMIRDLKKGVNGHHASNLGGILSYELARRFKCHAFIVDPVVVDEMDDVARLSGFKDIERKSIFHALNQKSAARKAASVIGRKYKDINLVVAHMGGGVSIGLHKKGRVVDVNNALNGDGPYAVERTGGLPIGDTVKLILDKKYTPDELLDIFSKKGGVYSYLNSTDMIEIEKKVRNNDRYAELVVEGLAYQISKEIGSLSAAACGDIDAIVLTGGLANSSLIVKGISKRVGFIADVLVFAGEFELEALIEASVMALENKEEIQTYK